MVNVPWFWNQKRNNRTKYLTLLTSLPTSRKMVTEMMPESKMILEAICIINKVVIGTHDLEFIDAVMQNLLQSDASGVL